VTVAAGQTLRFDIDRTTGSDLDSLLRLFNAAGQQLASNDNGVGPTPEPSTLDSFLQYTFATAGTYYIGVSGETNTGYSVIDGSGDATSGTTGGYTLTVSDSPFVDSIVDDAPQSFTKQIIDNGDVGFATVGSWGASAGGYQNDRHLHLPSSGSSTATWTFSVPVGEYEVSATWLEHSNRSSAAPYSIYDGNTLLGEVIFVNQKLKPTELPDGLGVFNRLRTVTISSGTLRVVLGTAPDGYVIADAIRVSKVQSPAIASLSSRTDVGYTMGSHIDIGSQPKTKDDLADWRFWDEVKPIESLASKESVGQEFFKAETQEAKDFSLKHVLEGTYTIPATFPSSVDGARAALVEAGLSLQPETSFAKVFDLPFLSSLKPADLIPAVDGLADSSEIDREAVDEVFADLGDVVLESLA